MNGAVASATRTWSTTRTAHLVGGVLAALCVAVPVGLGLTRVPLPLGLELAAGSALLAVVVLAVARLDVAVLVGFALSGIVLVEPAPTDLVLGVVIAVAAVTGRFRIRVPTAALGALVVLVTLNLLSAVEVVDATRAVVFFAITAYVFTLAAWLSGYVTSARRARLVVGAYLLAAVSSAALGSLALLTSVPGSDLLVEGGRVRAFFQDPNVFGPFLVPIALILAEDLATPRLFGLNRLVKAFVVLMLVLGVVFSFSRGAWVNLALGAAVVLLVLGLRRGGGRKALLALMQLLGLAAAVGAILVATGSQDFLVDRARIQEYDTGRFSTHIVGVESAERYPLGVGPGQFESYAPLSAHSTYVRVVGEQGLPGLAALVVVLGSTLLVALANALAGRETYGIGSAALLGAWCGILVNSAVVDTLHWRHVWIVAALIWVAWARRTLRPRLARASRAATE